MNDSPPPAPWATFLHTAALHAKRVALVEDPAYRSLSFSECVELAEKAAACISNARLSAVMFFLPRCPFLALATLGASASGTPWVLGDASRGEAHRSAVITDLVARIGGRVGVVTCELHEEPTLGIPGCVRLGVLDLLRGIQLGEPDLDDDSSRAHVKGTLPPLYFVQTSGSSTGEPRWVVGNTVATAYRLLWGQREQNAVRLRSYAECFCIPECLAGSSAGAAGDVRCRARCVFRCCCRRVDVCIWRCPLAFVDTIVEMWAGLLAGCPTVVLREPGLCAASNTVAALVADALGYGHSAVPQCRAESYSRDAPRTDVAALASCIAHCGVTRLTATPTLLQVTGVWNK